MEILHTMVYRSRLFCLCAVLFLQNKKITLCKRNLSKKCFIKYCGIKEKKNCLSYLFLMKTFITPENYFKVVLLQCIYFPFE